MWIKIEPLPVYLPNWFLLYFLPPNESFITSLMWINSAIIWSLFPSVLLHLYIEIWFPAFALRLHQKQINKSLRSGCVIFLIPFRCRHVLIPPKWGAAQRSAELFISLKRRVWLQSRIRKFIQGGLRQLSLIYYLNWISPHPPPPKLDLGVISLHSPSESRGAEPAASSSSLLLRRVSHRGGSDLLGAPFNQPSCQ